MASLPVPHCNTGTMGPCWYSRPAAPDSETATAQTVQEMCAIVHAASGDPEVQAVAARAIKAYQPLAAFFNQTDWNETAACAAYAWCKANIRFQEDEITLARLLNKRGEQDFIQSPSILVRQSNKVGDCDCFTVMLRTLLACLGVPSRICTIKCSPDEPWRWSHVYACTDLGNGQRLALDASHGKYPGWEVPAEQVFEYAEWDSDGRKLPVSMRPRPMGAYRSRRGVRLRSGFRGLGDTCAEYDGDGNCLSTIPDIATTLPYTPPAGCYGTADHLVCDDSTGGGSAPASGGGTNWGADLTSLLTQATRTIGGIIQPMTTVRLANGSVVSVPAGSSASTQLLASVGSISSTTWLLIAAGVAAVVVLPKLMGGR